MADKAPAYQWLGRDAEADEKYRLMNVAQLGIYERLRDHEWYEGSVPSDESQLIAIIGHGITRAQFRKLWPGVACCFHDRGDGRLINARLELQRTEQRDFNEGKSRGGQASAEARRQKYGTAQPNSPRTAPEQPVRAAPEPASASATASAFAEKKKKGALPSGPLPGFRRLRVFRWMVDDLLRSIGGADFDLEKWLERLDADEKLIIPADQDERWKWLQRALDYELRQRGMLGATSTEAKNERVRELLKQREAQA